VVRGPAEPRRTQGALRLKTGPKYENNDLVFATPYSHVLASMQQGAAEKLEKMLFTNAGTLSAHETEEGSRKDCQQVVERIDEPCRTRTCDPLVKSQLLYHLS
jgi:hypothetical protein